MTHGVSSEGTKPAGARIVDNVQYRGLCICMSNIDGGWNQLEKVTAKAQTNFALSAPSRSEGKLSVEPLWQVPWQETG